MLDREFVRSQSRRLSQLRFFPIEVEAVGELLTALQAAPTEEACVQFVGDWMRLNREAPLPVDCYDAFGRIADESKPLGEVACAVCDGTGWRVIERGSLSGVTKCACRTKSETTSAKGAA